MSKPGTFISWAIILIFGGGAVGAVALALRGTKAADTTGLTRAGWAVAEGSGSVRWRATRDFGGVIATVTATQTGNRTRSSRTLIEVPSPGPGAVLVTRKGPAMLAVDGALASAVGFTPPPRWSGGSPAFEAVTDAFATDEATGARWLTPAAQQAVVSALEANGALLGVSREQGRWTAQLGSEIADPAVIDGVVSLLLALRGRE